MNTKGMAETAIARASAKTERRRCGSAVRACGITRCTSAAMRKNG